MSLTVCKTSPVDVISDDSTKMYFTNIEIKVYVESMNKKQVDGVEVAGVTQSNDDDVLCLGAFEMTAQFISVYIEKFHGRQIKFYWN